MGTFVKSDRFRSVSQLVSAKGKQWSNSGPIKSEENTIMRQKCCMMRMKWDKCVVELRRDSGVGFFQDPATWASEEPRHDWYIVIIMTHYHDHDKPRWSWHTSMTHCIAISTPSPWHKTFVTKVSLSTNSRTLYSSFTTSIFYPRLTHSLLALSWRKSTSRSIKILILKYFRIKQKEIPFAYKFYVKIGKSWPFCPGMISWSLTWMGFTRTLHQTASPTAALGRIGRACQGSM